MDELSEEDKLTVSRARKMQKFLSQPFQVAEVFTGSEGKYVPLKETISGFKKVLSGELELSECILNYLKMFDLQHLLYSIKVNVLKCLNTLFHPFFAKFLLFVQLGAVWSGSRKATVMEHNPSNALVNFQPGKPKHTCANSADPDEMAHSELSYQDLDCLPFCFWF